jgi:hypothetical protein
MSDGCVTSFKKMLHCAASRGQRAFHAEKKRIPKTEDSLAERGGFEPSVPLELYLGGIRPEFGALLRPNNSIRAGENLVLA